MLVIPAKAGIQLRAPQELSYLESQSFHSPFGRASYFWHCPKVTKRLGAQRGGSIRIVRIELPCASRRCGVAQTVRPCTAAQARRSIAAPLWAFPARAAMLGTANGAGIHESVHPWTASVKTFKPRQICGKNEKSELSLLRQDAAQTGPRKARRRRTGKARRGARRMRASSLVYTDVHSANLRSAFAHPQGRMPGGRAFRGVLSLVTLFAQAKRVTRSAVGRVEALLLIRARHWIPVFAGMTRKEQGKYPARPTPSGSLAFDGESYRRILNADRRRVKATL